MREQNLPRTQAITQIVQEADTAVQRFLDHERQIPALCSSLALTASERTAVHEYTDVMRTMIRGNYDWHRTAGRYSSQARPLIAPTARSGA
jgi:pentalenene synthase